MEDDNLDTQLRTYHVCKFSVDRHPRLLFDDRYSLEPTSFYIRTSDVKREKKEKIVRHKDTI